MTRHAMASMRNTFHAFSIGCGVYAVSLQMLLIVWKF